MRRIMYAFHICSHICVDIYYAGIYIYFFNIHGYPRVPAGIYKKRVKYLTINPNKM